MFDDDQPAAGATVVISPATSPGHILATATADASGAFRLRVLASVTYLIRAGTLVAGHYHEREKTMFVTQQVNDLRISIPR